jgi:hypothetical protein
VLEPEFDCNDIFEYDRNAMRKISKVYLHPNIYKTVNGFKATEGDVCGWKELLNDLEKTSRSEGVVIVSNGGNASDRKLLCQRGRIYTRGKKKKDDADE